MSSSATTPDESVQFRLRINQKGAWQSWDRVVNSNMDQSCSTTPKDYLVFLDPVVTGPGDENLVFSFDILSFDVLDNTMSWLFLEELMMDETSVAGSSSVASYDFSSGADGWIFKGTIAGYDTPLSAISTGVIGLSPVGSTNCFSFWESPDLPLTDGYQYRATWQMGSSAPNADLSVQFRLRVNQKGSWQAWDRGVNSFYQNAPAAGSPKMYHIFFDTNVTGSGDDMGVMSFDIMSFDPADDLNSWILLDSVLVESITLAP
jgi:hypothetical protein